MKIDRPIFYFDGECNLCNSAIHFVIKHQDFKHQFFITSLQGMTAKKNLPLDLQQSLATIVVELPQKSSLEKSELKFLIKSKAIFFIAANLKFPFSMLRYFDFLPVKITDFLYDIVAKNRYSFFGKKKYCEISQGREASFFLP